MAVNNEIAAMKGDYLTFINLYPLMLGDDGLPKKDAWFTVLRDAMAGGIHLI